MQRVGWGSPDLVKPVVLPSVNEVRGLDDERIALPVAANISIPLTDIRVDMRPRVDWNDATLAKHLVENHDVVCRLDNLMIRVV